MLAYTMSPHRFMPLPRDPNNRGQPSSALLLSGSYDLCELDTPSQLNSV